MFTHFTLGTNDRPRAEAFYAAVMPPLGLKLVKSAETFFAYGTEESAPPWLVVNPPFDGLPATWSNGFHIALRAGDEAAVRDFHRAALGAGGRDEGAPGLRPEYASDYYAAYVRDPDGNKLQAVYYRDGRVAGPCGDVVSHITLGSNDLERSKAFYEGLLAVLGLERLPAEETPGEDLAFGIAGSQLPVVFLQKPFDGRSAPGAMAHTYPSTPRAVTRCAPFTRRPCHWAAATRASPACGPGIMRPTTRPTCATPTATSCRPIAAGPSSQAFQACISMVWSLWPSPDRRAGP